MTSVDGPPPQTIGAFEIVQALGVGGMGVVYEAIDARTRARVAIKTVRMPEPTMLGSLRREMRALASLDHPNIVRVVDHGVTAGLPWYAMDFVTGRTLRQLMQSSAEESSLETKTTYPPAAADITRITPPWWTIALSQAADHEGTRPWSPGVASPQATPAAMPLDGLEHRHTLEEAMAWMVQLCDALAYLHGEGIVHRDLKPDNVIIRDDGTAVLVDFGLVMPSGGAGRDRLTITGDMMGTLAYMAPEQIEGRWVDARADLYALGCMLYELVTRRRPFTGPTTAQLMYQHMAQTPTPPSQLCEDIPESLEAIILQLLQKSPYHRPGHAEDISGVLRPLLSGNAVPRTEVPPSKPYLYRPDFAGRRAPLDQLSQHLARLQDDCGDLVFVQGESGVGKTRLGIEFLYTVRKQKIDVLIGEFRPLGAPLRGLPIEPLIDRMKQAGSDELAEFIRSAHLPVLGEVWPELMELPGASALLPTLLPPSAARNRLFSALWALFAGVARRAPLVVMLDDLHWADELSLGWLDYIARHQLTRQTPLLFVSTLRPGEAPEPLTALLARCETITLERLAAADIERMVCSMLAIPSPPAHVRAFLMEQSEGNPFFVGEYLRSAMESGLLTRGADGTWHFTDADLGELALPSTLRELIEQRVERIPGPARAVLEAAAVLGKRVSHDALRAVLGLDEDALDEALAELHRRELLELLASGAGLGFTHDKIREVAVAALAPDVRRSLHQRAVHVYRAASEPVELAYHWSQVVALGGRRPEELRAAADALQVAGMILFRKHAPRDAIARLREALAIAELVPQPVERTERVAALLVELGPMLIVVEGWGAPEIAELYERASSLHAELGEQVPPTARFAVQWGRWLHEAARHNMQRANALCSSLLELAAHLDEPAYQLQAHHAAWPTAFVQGRVRETIEHAQRGAQLYHPKSHHHHADLYGGHDPGLCSHCYLAFGHWLAGDDRAAQQHNRESLRIAAAQDHTGGLAVAHNYAAILAHFRRDAVQAEHHGDILRRLEKEKGANAWRAEGDIFQGWARVMRGGEGAVEDGLALLRQGLDARRTGATFRPYYQGLLAEALIQAGRVGEAAAALTGALGDIAELEHWWAAELHRLRGSLLERERSGAGARWLEKARHIAARQGALSLETRAAIELARPWLARGERARAVQLLQPLCDRFPAQGATQEAALARALLEG